MRPTQVLAKICKDEGLDGPHYSTGRVRIDNKVFGATSQVLEESGMCLFLLQKFPYPVSCKFSINVSHSTLKIRCCLF